MHYKKTLPIATFDISRAAFFTNPTLAAESLFRLSNKHEQILA